MNERYARPYAHVIGDPISQSKSPIIHRFWLERLGLDADYGAFHVKPSALGDYLEQSRADENWRGCNVTMPHKQTVMPYLASFDPLAARVGAVNTVVRQPGGGLKGFNTDVAGFLEPLAGPLRQTHLFRMARVLGTGGAARAIVTALSDHNMVMVLAGRDVAKASALLRELAAGDDHHVATLDHFANPTDFAFDDRQGCFDLIVNTTPLGMRGQPPLQFDFSHAPPGSIVYDIVTDPVETDFLKSARDAGFPVIDGLSMLIGQAAAAFEMFFHAAPPRGFDTELRERLMV